MWKDAYAVGNELIDGQHKELFMITDNLVSTLRRRGKDAPAACERAVGFLKNYVIKHFADEEAFQESIGYEGLSVHRRLHADFVVSVSEYEKRLIKNGFDRKTMQLFAGKLVGWLIYHVMGEDRKIVGLDPGGTPRVPEIKDSALIGSFFVESTCEVLGQMLGIPLRFAPDAPTTSEKSDISVNVGILGDRPGSAEFVFPLVTALRIVQSMAMVDPAEFEKMAESALREIANIISGNAASKIAETGCVCDITTPKLYRGQRPLLIGGKVVKCDLGAITVFHSEARKPLAPAV
jgi:hemerythrin